MIDIEGELNHGRKSQEIYPAVGQWKNEQQIETRPPNPHNKPDRPFHTTTNNPYQTNKPPIPNKQAQKTISQFSAFFAKILKMRGNMAATTYRGHPLKYLLATMQMRAFFPFTLHPNTTQVWFQIDRFWCVHGGWSVWFLRLASSHFWGIQSLIIILFIKYVFTCDVVFSSIYVVN